MSFKAFIEDQKKWWCKSYLADYATVVALIVIVSLFHWVMPTYDMAIPTNSSTDKDDDLLYPFKENTITMTMLIPIVAVPIVVIFIVVLLKTHRVHDFHNAVLALVESVLIALVFTEFGKSFAGRLRPHYYQRVSVDPADAKVSYPSGHSSTSAAALALIALYIAGKLRTFRHGQLWKAVISGVWLFGAFAIAITRTRDYHHNFSDINAGMAIGFLSALVGYHLNFYPLTSKRCYLPINRLYAPDAVQ